ncbi:MAG: aromatic hydrocarbon degradation protein [Ancylobacter novellus]|uniref:Aromatic hydrocarbon degradation protein n=1 Tax=Ancylobacter novellus TaxID=921 RepID=A0A2W5MK03_ANCNO|nr:MAG: aromatic hydrocarbon degradation protein [Ancylobacter novellus]
MSGISGRAVLLPGAVALGALLAAAPALAGGFALREQSAVGQGMSFAGAAAGGGDSLSGMFWNPAVVNQVEHFQGEQVVTGVFPSSKVDVTGGPLAPFGDGGDIGESAGLTAGYSAYRITDQLAVGLSVNTPFGLATDPDKNWGGQIYARSSRVRSVNATPTVGYKVNEWFSIAAGVQIQWFDIRLRQAVSPAPGAETATLKGDDFGVGFTAGFTVAPMEGTSIGVGFRSKIEHDLKGDLSTPAPDLKIKAKVTLPETVTVGLRQKVTDDLTALVGAEWTNWSRLGTVDVKTRGGAPVTALPFDYKDGWFVSGGLEYAWSPEFTLRGGVAYEWSPINDKNRTVRLPDDDRWWFSAGGSYKYSEKLAFDLGYSFVYVPGKSKITVATPVPFAAEAKSDVHIVSASVRYKFGGDAPAALVTKY